MAVKVSPQDVLRLQQARTAFLQNRVEEALRHYEKLAKTYPDHRPINAELAQIYVRLQMTDPADRLLQKLLQQHSSDGRTLILIGQNYRLLGNLPAAVRAFKLALLCSLAPAEEVAMRAELATVCERSNDLTEAQLQVEWLLRAAPESATAQFLAGLVASRFGDWQSAEAYLRKTIELVAPSEILAVQAKFELAVVLDKQGHYAEAFQSLTEAKQVPLPGKSAAQQKSNWVAGLTAEIATRIQPQYFEEWQHAAVSNGNRFGRPYCLLTGHPRSGTTLLEQILDSHPAIASADESSALLHALFNPVVFANDMQAAEPKPIARNTWDSADLILKSALPETINTGLAQYRQRLEQLTRSSNPKHLLIDKNPEAIVMLPVLQRALPAAKVIVMIRDPRDVCLSCFQQFLPVNAVSVNYDTLEKTALKYARTMNLWLTIRPHLKLDWLEVKYESLVADPAGESQRVLEFLELPWDNAVLQFTAHVRTKAVRSPTYHAVAKPVYQTSHGRWRKYESHFENAMPILQPLIETLGY